MKVKVRQVVNYGGHSLKANGSVDLTLKAKYDQITKSMQLLQLLNNDVALAAKITDGKPFKLGSFRIKEIKFDGDGESVLKFNSLNDYVEVDNLNNLVTSELFNVLFEADVDVEEEEEDGTE